MVLAVVGCLGVCVGSLFAFDGFFACFVGFGCLVFVICWLACC